MIGDFNALVWKEECYSKITGGQSNHLTSIENGIKVIKFSIENNIMSIVVVQEHSQRNIDITIRADPKSIWSCSIRDKKLANSDECTKLQRGGD